MRLKLLKIVPAFLVLSCMLSLVSCNGKTSNDKDVISQNEKTATKKAEKNEFKSEDGSESLFAPKSWISDTALNNEASIQISNRMKEKYVIVITEEKELFSEGLTLAEYTELVNEMMQGSINNVSATDIQDTTVNGKNAQHFELAGDVQNIKVTYFITVVESDNKFHQIIGWTLTPKVQDNKAEILEVMNSFTVNQ